jgi:hypothetical protein
LEHELELLVAVRHAEYSLRLRRTLHVPDSSGAATMTRR